MKHFVRTATSLAFAALPALAGCTPAPATAQLPLQPGLRARMPGPGVVHAVARSGGITTRPWVFRGAAGKVIETPWHRMYTTSDDAFLVSRLPRFMEAAHAHRVSSFSGLPAAPEKLDTYLFRTRFEWLQHTADFLAHEDASTALRIQRGGFAFQGAGVFYDIGPEDTFGVAAHEGWHQYVQTTFAEGLPPWLDEAIATWMEGRKWNGRNAVFLPWANTERFDTLRAAAAENQLFTLSDIVGTAPAELIRKGGNRTLIYYAQVWALAHFLYEGDGGTRKNTLQTLLQDAAEGRCKARVLRWATHRTGATRNASASVFGAYFGEPETLDAAYRDFIAEIVRTGGRDRIVAGRSPIRRGTEPNRIGEK